MSDDSLKLKPLFAEGGEVWEALLRPTIEAQPGAAHYIGPTRAKGIVPVRELTFQALKPNPPEAWQVVVFGQNPYPRVESATGIAMFDNAFNAWADSKFGRTVSMRCIIKAAAIWKHGVPVKTRVGDLRKLLAKEKVVAPPEWFQSILTQGVLLLNTALTVDADDKYSTVEHTTFWRPVIERIVEAIFEAKRDTPTEAQRGVVFAWWGAHARKLRPAVQRIARRYPTVRVVHIDHCNPAAQGDIFCKRTHFADINHALDGLGMHPIDWLPEEGWADTLADGEEVATAARMGDFITRTSDLHKLYLERLQDVQQEVLEALAPIDGVMGLPIPNFEEAMAPIQQMFYRLAGTIKASQGYATRRLNTLSTQLTADEVAAVHIYTTGSSMYRVLNAALRNPNRTKATPYLPYLRPLLSALGKLSGGRQRLWRGVPLDLASRYPSDGVVTWWGVSSCTVKKSVATGFMGGRGRRTLFEIDAYSAVGIRQLSAFGGEEEYVLAPGTQLKVTKIRRQAHGLSVVALEEQPAERQIR